MAEVGPPSLINTSCTSLAPPGQTETSGSSEQKGNAIEQASNQEQEEIEKRNSKSVTSQEDDVQIVFSAPRRRRKRRQRLESSYSSMPSQDFQQSSNRILAARVMSANSTDPSATDIEEPLSTPSQADTTENNSSGLCNTLPGNNPSDTTEQHHQRVSNMNYNSSYPLPFTSFQSSTSWWNDPVPPGNRQSPRRNPLGVENEIPRKRKHEEELNPQSSHFQYRQSSQISPRSTPTTAFAPLGHIYPGLEFRPQETLGKINHNSMPTSSWSNLNWNAFDISPSPYYSENFMTSSLCPGITPSTRARSNNLENSSTAYEQPSKRLRIWAQPPKRMSLFKEPKKISQVLTQATHQLPQIQAQDPVQEIMGDTSVEQLVPPQIPPILTIATSQSKLSVSGRPQASKDSQEEIQPQPTFSAISPLITQTCLLNAQPADMRRKPSLYSIPPWPAASSQTVLPNTTREPHRQPTTISNHKANRGVGIRPNHTPCIRSPQMQCSNVAIPFPPPSKSTTTTEATMSSPACPQAQIPQKSAIRTAQIPNVRAGRKHSPNLIVDIAETSQEVFPFSALAARHEVPVQKVFDTFSAIIQLPLLRNADDRRRHGELGKRRMREYREAKKAMERAQEAERKVRLRKIREERAKHEREN